jgi:hypothetical protein
VPTAALIEAELRERVLVDERVVQRVVEPRAQRWYLPRMLLAPARASSRRTERMGRSS